MVVLAQCLKDEIQYNPTRFARMVSEHGGVETARRLLNGRDASEGFTTLWERRRLDLSVEASVLLPWFEALFSDGERAVARRRLTDHRFDVDGFVTVQSAAPPSWV
jgi:hypothetical protein